MKVTFKCEPGAEVNGVDQAGNVWPDPYVFNDKGVLVIDDDQQDVFTALAGAAAAKSHPITRAKGS